MDGLRGGGQTDTLVGIAHSKKEAGFWTALVAEAQTSTESLAAVAAKYKFRRLLSDITSTRKQKTAETTNKPVPMLPVRVDGDAGLFSIDMDGSLRLRFAEGCYPAYVAAVIAKLR